MAETEQETLVKTGIDYEDVDEIIGLAGEMSALGEARLSVEDLEDVAQQLGIPEEYVLPAAKELARRREQRLEEEAKKAKRKNRLFWALSLLSAFLLLTVFLSQNSLRSLHEEVLAHEAQVENVLERQAATEKLWADKPDSPQKMAELSGAENRVRIEKRRHDEALSAYNAKAQSFPTSLWRGLSGLPEKIERKGPGSGF